MQLTYAEIIDIIDLKYIPSKRSGYSLNPVVYELIEINSTLNYILLDNVKVNFTIEDISLKYDLDINQSLVFTNKIFFYSILGFTESHSGVLGDIPSFVQLIPGKYKAINRSI